MMHYAHAYGTLLETRWFKLQVNLMHITFAGHSGSSWFLEARTPLFQNFACRPNFTGTLMCQIRQSVQVHLRIPDFILDVCEFQQGACGSLVVSLISRAPNCMISAPAARRACVAGQPV
jgi:hypothetical protein